MNQVLQQLQQVWNRAVADLSFFLWGDGTREADEPGGFNLPGLAWTLNEQDQTGQPIQRFPDKRYLRELVHLYETERLLLIFKSRQLMCTWLMCAVVLHDCLKPGRRWLHICKKFDSADANLERMWTIYKKLPEAFRPKAERKQGFIIIRHPEADSVIQASAQNSAEARQYTFSGAWVDEGAFAEDIEETHTALVPTIQGGGRFVMTTTPNGKGEYFYQLATEEGAIKLEVPPEWRAEPGAKGDGSSAESSKARTKFGLPEAAEAEMGTEVPAA